MEAPILYFAVAHGPFYFFCDLNALRSLIDVKTHLT